MLFKFYCNISTYQILSSLWAITMEVGGSNPIRQRCSFDEEGEVHFFPLLLQFHKSVNIRNQHYIFPCILYSVDIGLAGTSSHYTRNLEIIRLEMFSKNEYLQDKVAELSEELQALKAKNEDLEDKVAELSGQLAQAKATNGRLENLVTEQALENSLLTAPEGTREIVEQAFEELMQENEMMEDHQLCTEVEEDTEDKEDTAEEVEVKYKENTDQDDRQFLYGDMMF